MSLFDTLKAETPKKQKLFDHLAKALCAMGFTQEPRPRRRGA
jgi:hypothetical protein